MDSKLMRRALLLVTMLILAVFILILLVNGYGTGKKKVAAQNTEQAETTEEIVQEDGQIIGSDLSAWMYDETFFDADKLGTGAYLKNGEESLAIVASSIEKDLRIMIVDDMGVPVSGRSFVVTLSDAGTFKDVDRDGVIYIGDMKPGEYEVALNQTTGYAVPEPLKVNVKAKIEYNAIADISYLIKTEEEINAKAEDTAINDAGEETTGSSAIRTEKGAVFGIDVSKWNGEIDWKQVKDAGVTFAIIRAGYRGSSSGALVVDPYFEANMKGAEENNIPVGVYFFTQAVSEIEAVEEASAVLSLIKNYDVKYPVFIDTEGAGGKGRADALEVDMRSKVCQAFCETIRSGNYTAGIYASKNWYNNKLDITKLSADNVTWLAEYSDQPSYGGTYQLWQYSSAGRVSGIEGRVDFNLSYLKLDENSNSNKSEDTFSEDGKEKIADEKNDNTKKDN